MKNSNPTTHLPPLYTYYILTFCISEKKSEVDTALHKKHADELARDLADERSSRLEEIQRMHDGT